MKNRLMGMSLVGAGLLASLAAPSVSQAAPSTCVAKLISNIRAGDYSGSPCAPAQFKLVIQRKNGTWVSYTDAGAKTSAAGHPFTGRVKQSFSDRYTSQQFFTISNMDEHSITINKDTNVMTIVNHTWNFTTTLSTSCNGDLITASDSANAYTISHRSNICII